MDSLPGGTAACALRPNALAAAGSREGNQNMLPADRFRAAPRRGWRVGARRAVPLLLGLCALAAAGAVSGQEAPGSSGSPPGRPPVPAGLTRLQPAAGGAPQGGRISVNFVDADVSQVLSTIAAYTRTDILITPGTTGKVTLNLRDRTAEEAIRLAAAA